MGLNDDIKYKYDKIIPFSNMDYTIALLNTKAGLINLKGNPLTEFIYDDLIDYYADLKFGIGYWFLTYENDYCSLRKNYKWGLLDKKGKILIDFLYDKEIYVNKEDNLYFVRLNSSWAIYDENWKRLNENLYEQLNKINNYIVFKKGKYGVMDLKGNIIIEPIYDYISTNINVIEGFWFCRKDNKYGVIDISGKIVIDFKYSNLFVSQSKKYISAVRYDNKQCGIIDINDNIIVDFIYDKIEFCESESFKQEYFLAYKNGKSILLNPNNQRII